MAESILFEVVPTADGWRVLRQGVDVISRLPSKEAALLELDRVKAERGVLLEFRVYDLAGGLETAWCSFSPKPDPNGRFGSGS